MRKSNALTVQLNAVLGVLVHVKLQNIYSFFFFLLIYVNSGIGTSVLNYIYIICNFLNLYMNKDGGIKFLSHFIVMYTL